MRKIFLISPYLVDPDFPKKKGIVKRLCRRNRYIFLLAEDEVTHESLDAAKTVDLFASVDYFIADLSFERPSCYFEVGFLQSRAATIFLIAKVGTPVHQLLNAESVCYYDDLDSYSAIIEKIFEDLITKHT